jgi:STE24 endopeptidase
MRTTTVSRVSGRREARVLGPLVLAAATAELGRRLLSPAPPTLRPAPVDLHDHFSPVEIDRGREFSRPQHALSLAGSTLDAALLAAFALRPPAVLARRWSRPVAGAAAVSAGVSLALTIPGLPLRAVARRRALSVGLATQSWRGWGSDLVKAEALKTGLVAAFGAANVALSQRYRERWWVSAALSIVAVGALAGALAPVVLDPIFNDFEPLPDGETRSDVLALAREAEVNVGEVYSVDASRRTTAANAYVTGIGPTKRVVLFDTMLDRYGRDEIRLVVAHELGHMRHRDVPRNLAYAALLAAPLAWGTQQVAAALADADPADPITPAALPAFALASALVSAPVGPIVAALSRAMERRADEFSLTLAGAPAAFISFERKAALQNLTDLRPRWLARHTASHPPTAERIGAAVAFSEAADEITGPAPAGPPSRS